MDFAGLQNYTREIVSHAPFMPFIKVKMIKAVKRQVETTQMGWEVYPKAIYHALTRWGRYENLKEIIVTENGAAFEDSYFGGKSMITRENDFSRTISRRCSWQKKQVCL